ncbi:MAG: glycosyl hydrolase [Maribacter sp.]|nr:glycosyl hydrolase [Maribacter sp.]
MKKLILLLLIMVTGATYAQKAEEYFKPLKFRNIGPFRGGRSVAATGVVGDPMTYYMGSTGGGLWKTTDGGQRWDNISDGFFEMGSVGAVTVSESDPNIIYCGMGEHAPRGVMASYGDGVYKSSDSGRTWKKLGLTATQHISRIIVHPKNPDIVYVAGQGALYGPTKERGIYKSIDGGTTWKNVLFVNDYTGCAELAIDANAPDILYAAMWEHHREPNKMFSGGPGSGLYKSVDAGESWFPINKGLPKEKGKMAISVSAANSNKVFALVESDSEADKGGLFVSTDAGKKWTMVSGDNRLVQRAWYYIKVFADPNNENVIYVMSAPFLRSIDGGKTWESLSAAHGDYHNLWINPDNSNNMVLADDGGASISFDFGKNWSSQNSMPTAQFYRISTDSLFPYNIYGGQQDNASVKIASLSLGSSGITDKDWSDSAGGESAFLAFDPNNPRYVLGGSYLGTIEVLDTHTKSSTQIMIAPIQYLGRAARDMKYLYNWNAPIIRSQHEPNTFYHCAQYVLRTKDMGLTWEEISPDLTRDIDEKQGKGGGPFTNEAVGAENYGTIAYMIESPHEKGIFYTGSDDGYVYITKDNGTTWQNITPKNLGETLVNAIEVSPHDPATVYIATTKYKFNDHTPAIYKSSDYGKSWENISTGIPNGAYTRVVREDEARKDLLYAGTEKGLYLSWNAGKSWESFQLNLPTAPITDLKIHEGNLIVATSGRSFWILDDLSALNQYDPAKKEFKIYTPDTALNGSWRSSLSGNSEEFKGTDPFEGINPANGMVIYYELEKAKDSTAELSLAILDEQGKVIRSLSSEPDKKYKKHTGGGPPPAPLLSKNKGLNRFVWDLNHAILPGIPEVYMEAGFRGHKASPGNYTLRLTSEGKSVEAKGMIKETPGFETKPGQYQEYDTFMTAMEMKVTNMINTVNTLHDARMQLDNVLQDISDSSLKAEGQKLSKTLDTWDEDMVQRKSQAYDDVENFPNKFIAEYLFLINATNSTIPRVNQGSKDRKAELDSQWETLENQARSLIQSSIPEYNKKLWEAGIGAIQL